MPSAIPGVGSTPFIRAAIRYAGRMSVKRWALVLAAWAVLFSGLTSAHAHVHLCLDGQEPPAAVHLADGFNHHHDHQAQTGDHEDVDLDLSNQALAKTFKYDFLPAIAPLTSWTPLLCSSTTAASLPDIVVEPRPAPEFSQPPSRAPPR